jgi:hypothetical protein
MAYSDSWPIIEYLVSNDNGSIGTASPCSWPNIFSCHLAVFVADFVDNEDSPAFAAGFLDDGKLGYGFMSADDLEEVDIGPGDKPRLTFISKKLDPVLRKEMIALLKEYRDCFAWDYTEMPGLDRSIIEHRLSLKKGFRPFQQRARQMKAEFLEGVKKELEKMLDAGFIRPCRYAEWISSMVLVQKKDGRWRVFVDFRDLNRATPKDEYPMTVAETLINAAVGHKMVSFMDSNAGYNQIFMAPRRREQDRIQSTWRGRLVRVLGYDLWIEKCRCNVPACHELHFS